MRSINGMAEKFRELLAAPSFIELPGCYDVLSGMMLEASGFNCVFLSGYGVAASLLGNPDIGLTSLAETSNMARNVATRLRVPLVVDADNGYGNEDNVIRTVQELEYAGAAVMVMEDQVLPKRCGHTGDKKILPMPLYMRKLECALRARETPMCIVARTDAMELDEAIMRAKAFHAAGADVMLIDGVRSADALKRIVDEVPGHKQVNLIYGGVTPIWPAEKYAEMGFKIVQYSTPALFIAAEALWKALPRLRETKDLNAISEQSTTFQDFQKFMERKYASRTLHADPDMKIKP